MKPAPILAALAAALVLALPTNAVSSAPPADPISRFEAMITELNGGTLPDTITATDYEVDAFGALVEVRSPVDTREALATLRAVAPAGTPTDTPADLGYASRPATGGPLCAGVVVITLGLAPPAITAGAPGPGRLCGIEDLPYRAPVVMEVAGALFGIAYADRTQTHGDGAIWTGFVHVTGFSPNGAARNYEFSFAHLTFFGADVGLIQTA